MRVIVMKHSGGPVQIRFVLARGAPYFGVCDVDRGNLFGRQRSRRREFQAMSNRCGCDSLSQALSFDLRVAASASRIARSHPKGGMTLRSFIGRTTTPTVGARFSRHLLLGHRVISYRATSTWYT